jgi:hypothetical protein
MGSMFSQSDMDNYRVEASINGIPAGANSSILRLGDTISPAFSGNVKADPDLTGLLVYIRSQSGETVGSKVEYVLSSNTDGDEQETDGQARGLKDSLADITVDDAVKITVESFAEVLPDFPMPENMEIGTYTFVFDAFGGNLLLNRSELVVFYLADAEFSLLDISMSMPSLLDLSLIPPGTNVFLEARLNFDSRLDPYLVWYSGRSIIREGRANGDALGIMWQAPNKTAFHTLRLEVMPMPPPGSGRGFSGTSREIMLPVSTNAPQSGFFFADSNGYPALNKLAENSGMGTSGANAGGISRWYKFDGNLGDAREPQNKDLFAIPLDDNVPRWASAGQLYGLSTGSADAFSIAPVNFLPEGTEQGGGTFLFHFRPLADATVFSVLFPAASPPIAEGAWMDLLQSEGRIVMRLGTAAGTAEIPVSISPYNPQTLVPAAVSFFVWQDRLVADISMGSDASVQSDVLGIELSGALSGEGIVRLGGTPLGTWSPVSLPGLADAGLRYVAGSSDLEATAPEEDPAWSGEQVSVWKNTETGMEFETADSSVSTIWDEFAVLQFASPLPNQAAWLDEIEQAVQ